MRQYNNVQWIEHFKFGRKICESTTYLKLRHSMKKNIRYTRVIPIGIWVTYFLYKLAHNGTKYLQCKETFAIGESIIHLVLHEFVVVNNGVFIKHIKWLEGEDFVEVMHGLKEFSTLSIHGTIHVTQMPKKHKSKSPKALLLETNYHAS